MSSRVYTDSVYQPLPARAGSTRGSCITIIQIVYCAVSNQALQKTYNCNQQLSVGLIVESTLTSSKCILQLDL